MNSSTKKVVICGAGFLGSNIARHLLSRSSATAVQLTSRNPENLHSQLASHSSVDRARLLPHVRADITKPETLPPAFEGADTVVSLVGIMHGSPADFERIQWRGAEAVARAAKGAGAKLIHISAIGADPTSAIPYARTKALGEQAVLNAAPDATIIRPSLVFGPGDGFFARFATLAKVLPFLPVFGGGLSKFQPVYVGDVARMVEMISRSDPEVRRAVDGKIIEAGGPDVFTYRELMQQVLKYSDRWRPIVSLPFALGTIQGLVLEQLPVNLFTVTRAQVEQLKSDNIVNPNPPSNHASFSELIQRFDEKPLYSVHEILPQYLGK